MAQVIRITENDLKDIISEAIAHILQEDNNNSGKSAWQSFKDGLNLKGLGRYAVNRIWDGDKQHKVGENSSEKKTAQQNITVRNHIENGGTVDNNGQLVGGRQSE